MIVRLEICQTDAIGKNPRISDETKTRLPGIESRTLLTSAIGSKKIQIYALLCIKKRKKRVSLCSQCQTLDKP